MRISDNDFYKFSMGQFVLHSPFRDVDVVYEFKNRTKEVRLGEFIKEEDLRYELDNARKLKFNNSELHYLRGTNEYGSRMFHEDYLNFLSKLELPPYDLKFNGSDFSLRFSGKWCQAIYWEIPALAIINELYYRALMKNLSHLERDAVIATSRLRLLAKVKLLRDYPEITFSDFGTRRRFSLEQQDYVVEMLSRELTKRQFLGTSNIYLAMKHGVQPMGTAAHELFMIVAGAVGGSDQDIRNSHNDVLRAWWQEYDWGLSIGLTDTFGSDFFFRDMTAEQARQWKGLRQDSGDPIEFGEKAIAFYKKHSVDAREKLIVFSDQLDVDLMIKLHTHFKGRIKTTFGWGTNLTNDMGFKTLSTVIKPVEASGRGLVKLSDNLAKAIGKPEDIERYKKIFGYSGDTYTECRS